MKYSISENKDFKPIDVVIKLESVEDCQSLARMLQNAIATDKALCSLFKTNRTTSIYEELLKDIPNTK